MQRDPKQIILEVLTIIGFDDNKAAFADEFIRNCERQAMADFLKMLSEDKKLELKQKLIWAKDDNRIKEITQEYIHPDEFKKFVEDASKRNFVGFMKAIEPDLTDEQMDLLEKYFAKLQGKKEPQKQ